MSQSLQQEWTCLIDKKGFRFLGILMSSEMSVSNSIRPFNMTLTPVACLQFPLLELMPCVKLSKDFNSIVHLC